MDFEDIYNECANGVYKFILKLSCDEHIAEEITQECFFRAYKNIETYNGKCKMSVWLCQIAKNIYFDYCKKKKMIDLDEKIPANFSVEEMVFSKETAKYIHMILHSLEEPYKEVFTLKVFSELSYKDISDIFGKSEKLVTSCFLSSEVKDF